MEGLIYLIVASIAILIIILIFTRSDHRHDDSTHGNSEHRTKSSSSNTYKKNYESTTRRPPVIDDIPIMSSHASQRMYERLGYLSISQNEMMNNAYKYGKTANHSTGDLKAKLQDTESKYEEATTAKFYNGAIYIFSDEDKVLKTVYKYDVNHYSN